jgi:hypothetical protein
VGQHRRLIVLALSCSFLLCECVAPARTNKPYVADAVTTAEQMNSAVQTALVAATSAAEDHAYGNYLSAVFGDTEDTAAAVQSNFDSEQPPSSQADRLRNTLDALLQDAGSILVALRIHTRRGEISRLKLIAQPLHKVSNELNTFIKAHR